MTQKPKPEEAMWVVYAPAPAELEANWQPCESVIWNTQPREAFGPGHYGNASTGEIPVRTIWQSQSAREVRTRESKWLQPCLGSAFSAAVVK